MSRKCITVIGCGRMGSALLVSLQASGEFDLAGVEKDDSARNNTAQAGISCFRDLSEIPEPDIIILAVKPGDAGAALDELSGSGLKPGLLISIAAGVRIDNIKKITGYAFPVVRAMPNTPAKAGMGLSCIACPGFSDEEYSEVEKIFSAVGKTLRVEESDMDTVTAISGSGPAYFFLMGEIMERFALKRGFSPKAAALLASATVYGAGAMMSGPGADFRRLRENVTSPGGTTAAALGHMSEKGFEKIFEEALALAAARSAELSEGQ